MELTREEFAKKYFIPKEQAVMNHIKAYSQATVRLNADPKVRADGEAQWEDAVSFYYDRFLKKEYPYFSRKCLHS